MSMRDQAIALAERGFRVFPLGVNSKLPIHEMWQKLATSDVAKVARLWTEALTGESLHYNIGIATGQGILAVDVDNKNGKEGGEAFKFYTEDSGLTTDTYTQGTPTTGRHYVYRCDPSVYVPNSTNKLGDGLDVRGEGGYIVAVGSGLLAGDYVLIDERDPAPAPDWFIEIVTRPRPKAKQAGQVAVDGLDDDGDVNRAIDWLLNEAPVALEGAGGDHVTFTVAVKIKDFGISQGLCLDLLLDHWNGSKAFPAWTAEALEVKVANAYRYGQNAVGSASPRAVFQEMPYEGPLGAPGVAYGHIGPVKAKARLFYLTLDEIKEAPQVPYLIKGLLDLGTMCVTYGESNSGKSNVVLDRALHIATGRPYDGRKVKQGAVVYVAAEGSTGLKRRIRAWKKHHKVEAAPFALVPCQVDLLRPDGDTGELIRLIRDAGAAMGASVVYVVIDTLARAMAGGDENTSTDMGLLVNHIDRIRAAIGCTVDVIHHSGKDKAKGARGHSSLRAATDTEIEVVDRTIKVTKQRDMEFADDRGFAYVVVPLDMDEDGQPLDSVVVRMLDEHEQKMLQLTKAEREIMKHVEKMLTFHEAGQAGEFSVNDVVKYLESIGQKKSRSTVSEHLKTASEKGHLRRTISDAYRRVDSDAVG